MNSTLNIFSKNGAQKEAGTIWMTTVNALPDTNQSPNNAVPLVSCRELHVNLIIVYCIG
jgi:hypothetical protein